MISDALAERYVDEGWWDGSTLAAGCASTRSTSPKPSRSSTRPPTRASATASSGPTRAAVAGFLGDHGVWPGQVVSVQLPNWYETVAIDLGVLARGAVLNPLLPNYRARELDHVMRTASTKLLFTPDEFRGFDHAALGREPPRVDRHPRPPRRRPGRRRLLAARARPRSPRTSSR